MTKEEAIRILASSCIPGSKQTEALETLIPELAESEDERIRKFLVDFFASYKIGDVATKLNGVRIDDILAYLEKQKAKEKQDRMMPVYNDRDSFESALDKAWKSYNESGARTVDSCEDDYVECAHAKGFREGYLFGLEKQKEQKPSINIDQLKSLMLQYLQEAANEKDDLDIEADTDKWARKILGYDFEQKPVDLSEMMVHKEPYIAPVPTPMVADGQKLSATKNGKTIPPENYSVNIPLAEWSEEYKRAIDRACVALRAYANGDLPEFLPSELIGYADRLQSLRPQPKQEWSEEDEDMIRDIIASLDDTSDFHEMEAWLKSLRPSWKPNDEDEVRLINTSISFLKDFADKGYENAVECIDWLKSKL